MKTRRTQVFKESSALSTSYSVRRVGAYERGLYWSLRKKQADIENNTPALHAEFWAMVAEEMSQPDAVFLKIV